MLLKTAKVKGLTQLPGAGKKWYNFFLRTANTNKLKIKHHGRKRR